MIEVYNIYMDNTTMNVEEVPLLLDDQSNQGPETEKRKGGDETKEKSFPAQNRQQVHMGLPHR